MDEYIQRLEEKGRKHLEGGDYGRAVKTLNKALAFQENHVIRNNLAMAYYLAGDYEACLQSLQLNMADGTPRNPYAHSLACLTRSGKPLAIWNEYAVIVLRAGLIFVGRVKINGRNTKIATIPIELRPVLCRLLS